MKSKIALLLGVALMITGCGGAADAGAEISPKEEIVSGTESGGTAGGNDADTPGNSGSEGESQDTSSEADGEEGAYTAGGNAQDISFNIDRADLKGGYERATFFADEIYKTNGENTIVSPLSLEMALGLAAEGASGHTADELYAYLGNKDYSRWARDYMKYASSLKSERDPNADEFEFSYDFCYELADSIWIRRDYELQTDYKKAAEKYFSAEAENVDFVKDADRTAERINSWCNDKTHGMIPEVVNTDMFSEGLSAILMNTVYFESPWREKWGTVQHGFTNLDGKYTTQEMLSDTLDVYYENEYATGFSKSYLNGFTFVGILPKEEGEFNLSDLDIEGLMDSASYDYDVKAIMPKLDFETTTACGNIIAILEAEGVNRAFDKRMAEFDGIVEGHDLYIDEIMQKCKIELDEEGTRAAAVTAMMMLNATAVFEPTPVKEVYLDRPFAFMIYDSVNDQIVFIGKVTGI